MAQSRNLVLFHSKTRYCIKLLCLAEGEGSDSDEYEYDEDDYYYYYDDDNDIGDRDVTERSDLYYRDEEEYNVEPYQVR